MSSGDESDDNLTGVRGKRRRALRACDNCRRRKVRCDGDEHVGSNCSNCATYRLPCSYLESAKKRESSKAYIESLENRLEKLEAYIQKINPGADISQVLGPTPVHTRQHPNLQSGDSRSPFALPAGPSSSPALPNSPSNLPHFRDERDLGPDDDDDDDDADDEKAVEELRKEFHEINLGKRFFGKSSGVAIVKTALNMKLEASGGRPASTTSSVLWQLHKDKLRDEFWTTHPWEHLLDGTACAHQFPEPDLLSALVDLFFVHINIYKPMLHRPTLEKDIADGLHVRNHAFGGVVLLVCACASRYSDDSRVKLEPEASWHTSGWKWFTQVHLGRKALLTSPSLHDIQAYTLAATFLQGSSVPVSAWTLSGIALRMIQDVGAHRRKVYGSRPTVEGELWKRAFWSLFLIDRWMSSMFGRPCALQDEDFDVEYPVECDDEYWTPSDPTQAFQQPPGKPSRISHFVGLLKLGRILGFAIRTIYAINKSSLGFTGPRWEQHIVAELDSALNKWLDSVPDHLHWDPTRKDDVFFIQSAHLFSTYHMLQITVHRPFIPSPSKPSTLPYPSLSICTNAARLSSNIIDTCLTRMPDRPFYSLQGTAFASGIILLLNLWSAKLSGMPIDITKEMVDIQKCMRLLKSCETRTRLGGRVWDVLNQLSTIGETPLQEARASQLHQPCCLFGETSSSSSPSTSSQKSYCGLDFGIAPRIVPSQSYTDTQNEPRIELTQPWADSHMFQGSPAFSSGGGVNGSTSTWLPQQNDLSRLPTTATSFGLDGRGDGGVGKIHPIGSQSIFSQATPDAAGATCTPSYMFGFGREFNFEGIPGGEELKDGEMGGNLGGSSNSSSEVFNGMLPGIPSSLESGGLGGLGFVDSGAGMWTSSYGLDGWDAYIESIAGGMGFATTPFADGGLGGPPGGESSSQAGNSGGR